MKSKEVHTEKKIKDVFLELYKDNPLDKISIKKLSELADINRGTFYLHYLNLDDLITSIEDEQLQAISSLNYKYHNYYFSKTTEGFSEFFIPTFKYIEKNKYIFKSLCGPNSRPRFRMEFQKLMHENMSTRFSKIKSYKLSEDFIKIDSVIEFTISGSVGLIITWLNSDTHQSPEELARLIAFMVLNGCFSCVENINKRV